MVSPLVCQAGCSSGVPEPARGQPGARGGADQGSACLATLTGEFSGKPPDNSHSSARVASRPIGSPETRRGWLREEFGTEADVERIRLQEQFFGSRVDRALNLDWMLPNDQFDRAVQEGLRRNFPGEQILWPDHCVAETHGAGFHSHRRVSPAAEVVRKGTSRYQDSCSAFCENERKIPVGLNALLREAGVGEIFLAGRATIEEQLQLILSRVHSIGLLNRGFEVRLRELKS